MEVYKYLIVNSLDGKTVPMSQSFYNPVFKEQIKDVNKSLQDELFKLEKEVQ